MTHAGPEVGTLVPQVEVRDLEGHVWREPNPNTDGRDTLLVFVAPHCPTCSEVAPALRSLSKTESSRVRLLLASLSNDETANREFLDRHSLGRLRLVMSEEIGARYNVSIAPYAILFDGAGIVRAKGLVNRRDHLESLLNAKEMGFPSVEEFVKNRSAQPKADAGQT